MLAKLKEIFPNLVEDKQVPTSNYSNYYWFTTSNNEIIGLPKDAVTDKEVHLLSTFLTPFHHFFPNITEQEKIWQNRIHSETGEEREILNSFRFVFFSIQQEQLEPKQFKEAINEFFHKEVSILWENNYEGIIIEEHATNVEEDIPYEQIIDVLMSDLYVNLKVFVGPYQYNLDNVKLHYENILKTAKVAFRYTDKIVLNYIEAIPFLLMEQLDTPIKDEIRKNVLKDLATDPDFLQTIETFLESNLNISVAAKKMYMHRNSLQYRIDKFHELTGIDIRDFHQAVTVYLALITNH